MTIVKYKRYAYTPSGNYTGCWGCQRKADVNESFYLDMLISRNHGQPRTWCPDCFRRLEFNEDEEYEYEI